MTTQTTVSGTPDDVRMVANLLLTSFPLIIGAPGTGKSAFARSVAEYLLAHVKEEYRGAIWYLPAGQITLPELMLPYVQDGKLQILVNSQLGEQFALSQTRMNVVIVDDIHLASLAGTMAPFLALTDQGERRFGFSRVPPSLRIIITANEPGDVAQSEIIPPLVSRCSVVSFVPSLETWPSLFADNWGRPDARPDDIPPMVEFSVSAWKQWREMVAAFVRFKNHISVIYTPSPPPNRQFTSPRAWGALTRSAVTLKDGNCTPQDVCSDKQLHQAFRATAEAYLPTEVATQFCEFVLSIGNIPSPEEILNNPLAYVERDQMFVAAASFLISGYMSRLTQSPNKLVERIPQWARWVEALIRKGYRPESCTASVWLMSAARSDREGKILSTCVNGVPIANYIPTSLVAYIGQIRQSAAALAL